MKTALADQSQSGTTGLLATWADVLVAAAGVTLIPDATHLIPLVPLIIFAPRIADRLVDVCSRPAETLFVPDPRAPDWAALARGLSFVGQQAVLYGRPMSLCISPFFNSDTTPRPYLLEVMPQRRVLRIREVSSSQIREYSLPVPLRLNLPQPLVVCDQTVTLQVAPLSDTNLRSQFGLSQRHPNPIAERAWFMLVLPLLWLPMGWRWSLVALVSLLIPPLSRLIVGGQWHPFRSMLNLCRNPQTPSFDLLRIWFAMLALIRWAIPASWPGYILQDGVALLFWGLLSPLLLHSGTKNARQRLQRRTRKPS